MTKKLLQQTLAVPAGMCLVPIEPTSEMIAAMAVCEASGQINGVATVGMAGAEESYAAMIKKAVALNARSTRYAPPKAT